MNDVHLTINGQPVTACEGTTILLAAGRSGIRIPFLCWSPAQNSHSNCGLCVVEIEGSDRLVPACSTVVTEGMVIRTDSEDIQDMRRSVIEVMFGDDVHDCEKCHRKGNCSVQIFLARYHLTTPTVDEILNALDA